MPILEVTSQRTPSDVNAFVKKLSSVFAEAIGKPEAYCLVTFSKVDELAFAASTEPGYLVKVGSIGNIDQERNTHLTKAVTDIIKSELGIDNDRGYVLFSDLPSSNVGFKGVTFQTILKK